VSNKSATLHDWIRTAILRTILLLLAGYRGSNWTSVVVEGGKGHSDTNLTWC
jgi:hypothetical protein